MRHTISRRQEGAVLVVALLFLVILTMLGVTAMNATTFEERMAGAARDSSRAFQRAEAALRDARRDINSLVIATTAESGDRAQTMHESSFGKPVNASDAGSCTAGRCRPRWYGTAIGQPLPPIPDVNWAYSSTQVAYYGRFTGAIDDIPTDSVSTPKPRYIIELFCLQTQDASIGGQESMCKFYRLTARGWGNNPNTQVTLQEVFLKI